MTVHESVAVRNAVANARETTIGTAPIFRVYDGAVPANCAASIGSSNVLLEITLPSDWLGDASSGAKAIAGGPWEGTVAMDGTATYYRIWDSTDTTCHRQGSYGTDFVLDTPDLITGRTVSITAATFTEGNA